MWDNIEFSFRGEVHSIGYFKELKTKISMNIDADHSYFNVLERIMLSCIMHMEVGNHLQHNHGLQSSG